MKKVFLIGLLLSVPCAHAVIMDNSRLIGAPMKDFMRSLVAEKDQAAFVAYYEEFSKLFEHESKEKQDATRSVLFQKGMHYLAHNDAATHQAVSSKIKQLRTMKNNKKELENTERFLAHCGMYASFIELKGKSAELKNLRAFADDSFTDFVRRIVAPQDQTAFSRYYEILSEKMNECGQDKRDETYEYLFSKALADLESNHADWYGIVAPYGSYKNAVASQDVVGSKARMFLRRYGAYQDYLIFSGQKNAGFLGAIGSFCSSVGKKVAGWFNSSAA